MKVSIDVQPLTTSLQTGIANYGYNIITELIENYSDLITLQYFNKNCDVNKTDRISKLEELGCNVNKYDKISSRYFHLLSLIFPLNYSNYFKNETDITYFFRFFFPRKIKGKAVLTLHDMVNKVCPETYKPLHVKIMNYELKKSVKRADHIITVSESSKKDIQHYLKVPEEKISVVTPAYDTSIFHPDYDANLIENCKQKYGINTKYILYVGTLEPRKNLVRLMTAYEKIFKNEKNPPLLVLAGGKGWKYKEIIKTASNRFNKTHVLLTGYIEDRDIPLLMNGAEIFAFPSIYEGFGMPPLEAMACGTPVLTSKVSSLPEVVGDAAVLVDPFSVEDVSEKLKELYFNNAMKKNCIEKGLMQCQKYSWKYSAERLHEIFEKIVGN